MYYTITLLHYHAGDHDVPVLLWADALENMRAGIEGLPKDARVLKVSLINIKRVRI